MCEIHEVFTAAQDALLDRLAGTSLAAAVGSTVTGGRPDLRAAE